MGLQTLSSRVNDPQNTFVLTVGMMNGGTQSNIIADEVELVGTTLPSTKPSSMGKVTIREQCYPRIVKANTCICGKRITTDKAFPSRGRCPEGADRVLAV